MSLGKINPKVYCSETYKDLHNDIQEVVENQKIYLVIGESGLYMDDYRKWTVRGFFDKRKAEDFKNKCQEEANRITKEIKKINEEIRKIDKEIEDEYYEKRGIVHSDRAFSEMLTEIEEATKDLNEKIEELFESHKYDPYNNRNQNGWEYEIEEVEIE